ncbi:hypothetical protein [Brucella pseudogrignonensis]|uniref:hypothetical protein n=1 Tax=Brucella pseudogrignonensis TaxID=419475 RepID=UPI0012ECC7AD|nr:hypothetical protein [Brucella pseudogrignonensis]
MPDLQCVVQDFASIARRTSASAAETSAMAASSLFRVSSSHKRSSSDLAPIFQMRALSWISNAISCAIRACFKRLVAARVAGAGLNMVVSFYAILTLLALNPESNRNNNNVMRESHDKQFLQISACPNEGLPIQPQQCFKDVPREGDYPSY